MFVVLLNTCAIPMVLESTEGCCVNQCCEKHLIENSSYLHNTIRREEHPQQLPLPDLILCTKKEKRGISKLPRSSHSSNVTVNEGNLSSSHCCDDTCEGINLTKENQGKPVCESGEAELKPLKTYHRRRHVERSSRRSPSIWNECSNAFVNNLNDFHPTSYPTEGSCSCTRCFCNCKPNKLEMGPCTRRGCDWHWYKKWRNKDITGTCNPQEHHEEWRKSGILLRKIAEEFNIKHFKDSNDDAWCLSSLLRLQRKSVSAIVALSAVSFFFFKVCKEQSL